MSILQVTLCLAFAASIAVGQVLFKIAANGIARDGGSFIGTFAANPAVWIAFGWYGLSSILWIYILMSVPLSRAYPFALVGAALVPLLSWLFFGEKITSTYLLGAAIVVIGLYVISAQPSAASPVAAEPTHKLP
jgi:drug/metabolite transporter (DMT)-like permease